MYRRGVYDSTRRKLYLITKGGNRIELILAAQAVKEREIEQGHTLTSAT